MVALLLFALLSQADEGGLSIRVLPEVTLASNKTVVLGDIAVLQGFSKRDTERLRAIKLGTTGQRGSEMDLAASDISRRLRQQLRSQSRKVSLQIPAKVRLQVPDAVLTNAMVEQALQTHWQPLCEPCEIKISDIRLPEIVETVADDGIQFRIEPELPKGAFSLAVDVKSTSGNSRVYWVSGRMNIYQKVPVATRAIAQGEAFDAASVKLEARNTTYASDGVMPMEKLMGQKSRAALSLGQIIWSNLIQKEKAFHRGDVVHLTASGTSFSVSATGIAEQDATIGDMVKVKSSNSGKLISGVAIGKNEVKVE